MRKEIKKQIDLIEESLQDAKDSNDIEYIKGICSSLLVNVANLKSLMSIKNIFKFIF